VSPLVRAANNQIARAVLRVAAGGVHTGDAIILRERVDRRTETSKVYQLSDGKRLHVIHGKPLHYREGGVGDWLDIDTTWQSSKRVGFDWEMTKGPYKVWAANKLTNKAAILVERKGSNFELRLGDSIQKIDREGAVTSVVAVPRNASISRAEGSKLVIDLGDGRKVALIANNHRIQTEVVAPDVVLAEDERLDVPIVQAGISAQADTYYGSTSDGYIYGDSSSYATARSTSTACSDSTTNPRTGQIKYGSDYWVYRGLLDFDTSGISGAVESAALYVCADDDESTANFVLLVAQYVWT